MLFNLAPRLSRGEDFSPVFIVGSGRSGNTLLRRLLMANDEVYIPPETYVLGPVIRDFRRPSVRNWEVNCARVLDRFATSEDIETFPTKDFRDVLDQSCDLEKKEQSLARVLDLLYRHLANAAGSDASRWGDKTPLNCFHLGRIHATFPNAFYVHVVRDGYDVVASYLKMGRYKSAKEAAERWQRSVTAVHSFERRHKNKVRSVHYEDLVTETRMVLTSICGWLGLAFTESMVHPPHDAKRLGDVEQHAHHANVIAPINAKSIGLGRATLSKEDMSVCKKIFEPDMLRLGYHP